MLTNFSVLKGFSSFKRLQMRSTSNHCVTLIIFFMSSSRNLRLIWKNLVSVYFRVLYHHKFLQLSFDFPIHLNCFSRFFGKICARWNMAPVLFLLFGSVFHDWRSKWWTQGHVWLLSSRVSRAWNGFKEKDKFSLFFLPKNVFSFRFLSPIRISRGIFLFLNFF